LYVSLVVDSRWIGCRLVGRKVLKGDGYGTVMDIAMGIGGAVAGALLMQSAGLGGRWGAISTTVVAVIGAIFLTLLAGFVNGRRLSARQL
jgi:uncharacterized membrane protein YeaQ/YmgE (transglycosylase-associated protein family)